MNALGVTPVFGNIKPFDAAAATFHIVKRRKLRAPFHVIKMNRIMITLYIAGADKAALQQYREQICPVRVSESGRAIPAIWFPAVNTVLRYNVPCYSSVFPVNVYDFACPFPQLHDRIGKLLQRVARLPFQTQ